MKNRYETLLILRTQGKEDTVKDMIDRLTADFKAEGAEIEQVQKMDKRAFTYVAGDLDSGYYANFVYLADPAALERLRAKLKLDPDVYRQNTMKLGAKKVAKIVPAE